MIVTGVLPDTICSLFLTRITYPQSPKLFRLVAEGMAGTKGATPEMAVLPDVIIVVEAENYKFYASGEGKNPSEYPYKEGLTVHQAISMAGA